MTVSSESAGLNTRGVVPMKSPLHGDYLRKARVAVIEGNLGQETSANDETLTVDDLYVVWFAKTLKNWKALVSTDVVRGHYWEVTYNGDKGETYVDTYLKEGNISLEDSYFDSRQLN